MSKHLHPALSLTAVLLAAALAVGLVLHPQAQETEPLPELILRYAENQPEGYPTTEAAYAFADSVSERTNGRVKVRVYSNGALGSETSVVEQMEYGGIDFSRISVMSLGEFVPETYVLQLPYLYEDDEHMWDVLNGPIGQVFLDSIKKRIGVTGLAWFDAGVRHFYTNTPVETLEDLKGLRIRIGESSLMQSIISALGAEPVPLTYDDVYSALAKDEIDGAENNWPSYAYTGHYEVAKYMLLDGHTRIPELLLASQEAMDQLSALDESYPAIVLACAREAQELERDLWAKAEISSEQQMRAAGVTVTTLSAAQLVQFREAVQPVYDQFSGQKALIERIRACRKKRRSSKKISVQFSPSSMRKEGFLLHSVQIIFCRLCIHHKDKPQILLKTSTFFQTHCKIKAIR